MDKIPIYSTFDLRPHAIEALRSCLSQHEVAEAYGVDRTTLYRWMQRFKHDGLDGLLRMPVTGRPRKSPDISDDLLKSIVLQSVVDFGFESDLWILRVYIRSSQNIIIPTSRRKRFAADSSKPD